VPQALGCLWRVSCWLELVTWWLKERSPRTPMDGRFVRGASLRRPRPKLCIWLLMLCAGHVHWMIYSEFFKCASGMTMVLLFIDLPQAVNCCCKQHAFSMLNEMSPIWNWLLRQEFAPKLKRPIMLKKMCGHCLRAGNYPCETELTGLFWIWRSRSDVDTVLEEIKAAFEERASADWSAWVMLIPMNEVILLICTWTCSVNYR